MSSEESPATPTTPTTPTSQQQENVFLVESVPRGFHNAIEILNILPEAIIDEMAFKILCNLTHNTTSSHSTQQQQPLSVDQIVHTLTFDLKFHLQQILFQQQLTSQRMRTPLQRQLVKDEKDLLERSVSQEIQNALNCLTFIYKSAIRNKVSTAVTFGKCLRRQTQMETGRIKILSQHYANLYVVEKNDQEKENTTKKSIGKMDSVFNLQRLKAMDWKLSVSMSSFCCENLNDAKVTLVFTLDDRQNNRQVNKHSVELSLEEFKQFYASFADMANLITTL